MVLFYNLFSASLRLSAILFCFFLAQRRGGAEKGIFGERVAFWGIVRLDRVMLR
jgi:hypothetical protein